MPGNVEGVKFHNVRLNTTTERGGASAVQLRTSVYCLPLTTSLIRKPRLTYA